MVKPKRPMVPSFKTEKVPSIPNLQEHGKRVLFQESDWARSNPSWRIQHLELCEPFGFHVLTPEKLAEILQKLKNFESMTWSEILIKSNKQNHSVEVWKLDRTAQKRLKDLGLVENDVGEFPFLEELVSLRLCGEERVWGILQGRVLHLLWWDPEHQVCPCGLKHT